MCYTSTTCIYLMIPQIYPVTPWRGVWNWLLWNHLVHLFFLDSVQLFFLLCCFVLLETLEQCVCPCVYPITTHLFAALCSSLLSLPQLFSVFVLEGVLLSLKAVICRKSCLATTWRDAKPLFTLHPLTSCAHYPLLFHSLPLSWRWSGMGGQGRQHSLLLSDEFRQQIQNKLRGGERVERGKRRGVEREEWHSEMLCLPVAYQLLFLLSSLQEEQAISLNSPSPTLHN